MCCRAAVSFNLPVDNPVDLPVNFTHGEYSVYSFSEETRALIAAS